MFEGWPSWRTFWGVGATVRALNNAVRGQNLSVPSVWPYPETKYQREKQLLLERSFKRKNLQVFCLVIQPYQSSSLLQMCCCVFWPCTLHASFYGAGQLLLVLPPWPVMPSLWITPTWWPWGAQKWSPTRISGWTKPKSLAISIQQLQNSDWKLFRSNQSVRWQ